MERKSEGTTNFFDNGKKPLSPPVLQRLIIKHFDRGIVPRYERTEYDSPVAIMQEA